MTTLLLSSD